MKINKTNLQQALEIVKPGLSNNEIIEQSTSFAFFGDRVVTYNDSISLSCPVEHLNLTGAIRAEELYKFLRQIEKEEIQVKSSENEIKLKSGNARAGIRLEKEVKLPIEEKGNIDPTGWKSLPEDFIEDLDFIKDGASKDMSRRVLTCVHVRKGILETSDGYQIMRVNLDSENSFPYPGTLIPAENISEIIKVEPSQIFLTDGWLHFKNQQDVVISCRILEDSFPDTDSFFDIEGDKLIFPKKMTKILDRVTVFTKKDHLVDEEMQIILDNNKLMVKGSNDYGWFKEVAPVKYKGQRVSFWIAPYLLKNILKRSNECRLGNEKIKFEGSGWEYVAVLREGDE